MASKLKKPQKSAQKSPVKAKTQASKPVAKAAAKTKPAAKAAPKAKAKAAAASVKPAKTAAKPVAKAKVAAKPAAKPKPAAKLEPVKTKAPEKKPVAAAKATPHAKAEARHPAKPEPKVESKVNSAHMKKSEAPKVQKAAETAPAKPAAKVEAKVEAKPEPRKEEKKPSPRSIFKTKEYVVYPAHGVGQILDIEEQEVAGHRLELFVINFDKEKMTLRVPTHKWQAVGMRKLSEAGVVDNAIETLRGRARIKRTMWSRRAQEYEAKINSGDLISIAEVVRDLYRSDRQPEQSYSERQLYEAALDRMAREVAVVERIGEDAAVLKVEAALQGGSGRSEKVPAKEAEAPEAA
ncbi:MAG: CarD family transcriptional regulator [Parvibaculum sp.]|uniref:CarD family transcriptional regulator n=1 Tax=Parvibaculum sp. TaxID=2024848 RepID=UPI0025D7307B|nr:CarD family transcriptional regulator [Parvibaculum sp.]MCE9651189.1 CarD family transcriptional regulator [Parvibaculum sp.]